MRNDLCCHFQRPGQFRQCDVTILRDQFFKKCTVRCELAVAFWSSLDRRRDIALLTEFPKPTDARGR